MGNFLQIVLATLLLALAGGLVFYNLIPLVFFDKSLRTDITKLKAYLSHRWHFITRYTMELGGYVHDTHMSQYIPPTAMLGTTGTYTLAAGAVTGTIAFHRAAAASTGVINIPIMLPSNSVALKGSYLKSVEVDYELLLAGATSITASLNKVTRGADGAVAVVSAVTVTQDLAAGVAAATQDQHKLTVTLTTPEWIDNDCYYLLVITAVCGGTVTIDVLGAVANFTARL